MKRTVWLANVTNFIQGILSLIIFNKTNQNWALDNTLCKILIYMYVHSAQYSTVQFSSVYCNHKNNTKETCNSNMSQIRILQMLCTFYNDEIRD